MHPVGGLVYYISAPHSLSQVSHLSVPAYLPLQAMPIPSCRAVTSACTTHVAGFGCTIYSIGS